MILYVTKATADVYGIKMPDELSLQMGKVVADVIQKESCDSLFEWGVKLLYFEKRKCLQLVNFASKLTLFFIDFKDEAIENIGDYIVEYLYEIYKDAPEMNVALEKYFKKAPFACYAKLTDKSVIWTLNRTQRQWARDGESFYEYIYDGIFNTKQLNKDINHNWLFTQRTDGKTEYYVSEKKFEKLIKERF